MAYNIDISKFSKNLSDTKFKDEWAREFKKISGRDFGTSTSDEGEMKSDWAKYNVNLSGNTNTNTNDDDGKGNKLKKFLGGGLNFLEKGITTQEERDYLPSKDVEMTNAADLLGKMSDSQGKLNDLSVIGKNLIEGIFGQLELYYEQQTGLIDKVNKQAGLTGTLAKNFREELTNANPRLLQLGIGFEELSRSAVTLVEQSGKFNVINQQTFEKAGEVATAYVGTLEKLVQMLPEFERIGIGAGDAIEKIGKAGKDAVGLGLRSQTVTDGLKANIGRLNEFGFKNGVEGLSSMVRKSIEFRMSMESVYTIAEKVMNPEGAIEMVANLQALGGAIGDFNDPFKLMYMATNDVEGLQDALIGAASSLTTYNTEQKRFEITGVNIRRGQEMAKIMNVDYKELTKSAIASAERMSALDDMAARGLTVNPEQKEFITNLAQMKDGKMSIEIGSSESLKKYFDNQSTVKLEQLTQEQLTELVKYQDELKQMSADDVVRQQVTSVMNIERDANYILALLRIQAGRTVDKLANKAYEKAGMSPEDLAVETRKMTKNTDGIRDISNNVSKSVDEAFTKNNAKKTSDKTSDTKSKSQTSPVKESKKTPDVLPNNKTDVNKDVKPPRRIDDSGKEIVEPVKGSLARLNNQNISGDTDLVAKIKNDRNIDQSVLIKNNKVSVELDKTQYSDLVAKIGIQSTKQKITDESNKNINATKVKEMSTQTGLSPSELTAYNTNKQSQQKEIIYVNVDKKQEIELLNTILTKLNESNNRNVKSDNSTVSYRQTPIETKESQESMFINAGFRSIDTNFKLLYDLSSKKSSLQNEETTKKEESPSINVNLTKQDTDSEKRLLFVKTLSDLVSEKNKEQKTPNLKEITQKDISDIEVFKLLNQTLIEFQKSFVKNGEQKLTGEDEINRNKKISDSFIQAINVIDKIKIEDVGRFTESFFEGIKNYFGKNQKTIPTEILKEDGKKVDKTPKEESYGVDIKKVMEMSTTLGVYYQELIKGVVDAQKTILSIDDTMSKGLKLKNDNEKSDKPPVVYVQNKTIENPSSKNNLNLTKEISESKPTPKETPVESAKETTSTIIHKHVIEMKIMPQGPIVDQIARFLYSDPSFVQGLIKPDSREFTSV